MGIYSFFGPFFSMPGKFLAGFPAAAGITLINSVGNLGGFLRSSSKDNCWKRSFLPKLKPIRLDWANFQACGGRTVRWTSLFLAFL